MPAAVFDITIEQGTDFTKTVTVKDSSNQPVDLRGATFKAKWRNAVDGPVNAEFACALVAGVTGNNEFSFSLAAAQVSNPALVATLKEWFRKTTVGGLPAVLGVYDILLVLSNNTKAIIRGTVTFVFSASA
jgi:hypothetical protein